MAKRPFVAKEQLDQIVKKYPTPFHLYDEKGIRETARNLNKAFSWNKGFKEYFAVKATPNPTILKILKEEGCGTDCSSLTELMMSDRCGFGGSEIMFSSNDTPAEEFVLAKKLGATINLDDITHIDFLKEAAGIPEVISCRYNPGGVFSLGTDIMDNPGDAKYGMTRAQMTEAFLKLKELGVKEFGIHSFLASNTVTNEYYPTLAKQLFCERRIIFICYRVAGQERMNSEFFDAQFFEFQKRLCHLSSGHAVLGISRVIHDICPQREHTARIVPTGNDFRDSRCFFQKVDMCNVIQIDRGSQFFRKHKFFSRCVVGRKHDLTSAETAAVGHHKFCQ